MKLVKYIMSKKNIGACPKCNKVRIWYESTRIFDSQVWFYWNCDKCGAKGIEMYNMIFAGHKILNEEQNKPSTD